MTKSCGMQIGVDKSASPHQNVCLYVTTLPRTGIADLGQKWVRFATNGTNPGFFSGQMSQNLLKSDLKKIQIC